ncbi:MAG: diaminopimelate decarboxylase [Bacteroidetes bacterium]|nr:diaminopimelate decarboxylase [Bacteroidota bacterium]
MKSDNFIKKISNIETPFYYYDINLLNETLDLLKKESSKYDFVVHYSLKANSNDKILSIINKYGFGADCVSGNEIVKAIETGFKAQSIVFAGVGKTDKEILTGINNNIFCFNVESLQEIEVINQLARQKNKKVRIALRINPDIDAKTNKNITTGTKLNKFGIPKDEINMIISNINNYKNIELIGIHCHIGSQITDMNVYKKLCLFLNKTIAKFETNGIKLKHINVGGGLGVNYVCPNTDKFPDFKNYFKIFADNIKLSRNQKLHFELGRSVVAQCGTLVTKVLYVKNGYNTKFAIVDAGMTNLIRPALYNSFHKIENISSNETEEKYDVVGPICESTDVFAKGILLPHVKRNNLIAIRSIGAYGEVMASKYNLRDIAKSVFV